MLTYRLRAETTAVVLHDSHTPPSQSDVQHFLAVGGREKGLLDIGYHFLILRDGQLIECRPVGVQGTHLRSKRNRDTIGVCLAGGREPWRNPPDFGPGWLHPMSNEHAEMEKTLVPADNFTLAQWHTLGNLMHYLCKVYPNVILEGHSEIDKHHHGACPPVDMDSVRARLIRPLFA